MADFNLEGLLGNAFGGGTGNFLDEYLTPEQRAAMQRNAMLSASAALLKAGGESTRRIGIGEALGGAFEAGQAGYEKAQTGALTQMALKQKLGEAANLKKMRDLIPTLFSQSPATAPVPTTDPGVTFGYAPDSTAATQPKPTINLESLRQLAALSPDPLATLTSISDLIPKMRTAGFLGVSGSQDNPFAIYANDETLPKTVRNIAQQYASSFSSGVLDPSKVDDRIKSLGEMAQRASTTQQAAESLNEQRQFQRTFQQSQADQQQLYRESQAKALEEQRAMMNSLRSQGLENSQQGRALTAQIAQGNLDLRRAQLAAEPPKYSYIQKQEIDQIRDEKKAAEKAQNSAELAARAAPLLERAYGSALEAGVKGLAGFLPFGSTDAKDANDKLVQINQQLALMTPKFGGPTSDADAKRYDTAVGDLGNPRKSIESKKDALKTIQELAAKQSAFATQKENYFDEKKTLKGFTPNPFGN
jgi:hypothetical protein